MRALRVVGMTEGGDVVLEDSGRRERFTVPADEQLRAAARGDMTRLGQIAIELESQLRPREIQARIRAGASVEQVASAAGVPIQKIERFAYPVLLERSRTAEVAQRAHPVRADGPDVRTLGDVVAHTFGLRGQEYTEAEWDSWKGEDGKWLVALSWRAGRSDNRAHWTFQPGAHGGTVTAVDEHASDLVEGLPARPLRPVGPVIDIARPEEPSPDPQPAAELRATGSDVVRDRGDHRAPEYRGVERRAPLDRTPGDRPATDRPPADGPAADRPAVERTLPDRPVADRPVPDRAAPDRTAPDRTAPDRTVSARAAALEQALDRGLPGRVDAPSRVDRAAPAVPAGGPTATGRTGQAADGPTVEPPAAEPPVAEHPAAEHPAAEHPAAESAAVEPAVAPPAPEPPAETAPVEAPEVDEGPATEHAPPAQRRAEAETPATPAEPAPRRTKKGKPVMPSWDEVLLGVRGQR
ncbi:septation protein SepH [Pseudonocardia hydrocarbonoxydans]|uniref:DUF3071 domain-containing protein n=1 Tax=Pseudonocardia hydrocarbonoxydans TaxID=76726 RepID=A0A4Y3WRT8_9PSEU|nr:septation protein SepH [Pseudonocardia hydrocarbonoxydans]GEC21228.1 hypothetical protein PHY01_35110 [Pseudonocardia hydrocarbonoxydans]